MVVSEQARLIFVIWPMCDLKEAGADRDVATSRTKCCRGFSMLESERKTARQGRGHGTIPLAIIDFVAGCAHSARM